MKHKIEFKPITSAAISELAEHRPPATAAAIRRVAQSLSGEHARICYIDGEPVGAGGVQVHHIGIGDDGRPSGFAEAWAIVAKAPPLRAWPEITRRALEELDLVENKGVRLIECSVDCRFGFAVRWAERLGFAVRGIREGWGPNGRDHFLCARKRLVEHQTEEAA